MESLRLLTSLLELWKLGQCEGDMNTNMRLMIIRMDEWIDAVRAMPKCSSKDSQSGLRGLVVVVHRGIDMVRIMIYFHLASAPGAGTFLSSTRPHISARL